MTQRPNTGEPLRSNRRDFLKASSTLAAAGALAGGLSIGRSAHAGGNELLKVGLIGCGGRGTGAAVNALGADKNCQLVAMADAFEDRLQGSLDAIKKQMGDKVNVSPDHCFVGLDAGDKLIQSGVDVVLLAEPPHFRPAHLKAAIEAGKHVFAEKPVAVDAPGIRSVLASAEEAKKKNLNLVAGLCLALRLRRVRDHEARSRRRHRRDQVHPGNLPYRQPLASSTPARLDRNALPDTELVLFQLALRRLQQRAARPQPGQGRLGDARRAARAGLGPGRATSPHRPEVRRYLRSPCRGIRVSQRRSRLQLLPANPRLLQRRLRHLHRHQGPGEHPPQLDYGRESLAVQRARSPACTTSSISTSSPPSAPVRRSTTASIWPGAPCWPSSAAWPTTPARC